MDLAVVVPSCQHDASSQRIRVGGRPDAVLAPGRHQLRPLAAFAGHVGYAHRWKAERWRSTACCGCTHVVDLDVRLDNACCETLRFSFNLISSPAPRMGVGIGLLTGRYTNKDRRHGAANQIPLGGHLRL